MKQKSVILKEMMFGLRAELEEYYDKAEAGQLTKTVLSEVLRLPYYKLLMSEQHLISEAVTDHLRMVVKQLKEYRPVQYIFGKTNFYGLSLILNESVLIPRPETEELVNMVINSGRKFRRIIDIGTGSGAIAICLQKHFTDSQVLALDISAEALRVAEKNAKMNNVSPGIIQMDFLDESQWDRLKGKFDGFVSNPPYVRYSEKSLMKKNVLEYEPSQALFVSDDAPLIFYEKLMHFAERFSAGSFSVFCEINEEMGDDLLKLYGNFFKTVEIRKDINNKDRFLVIEV